METKAENIVKEVEYTMRMENMPLTERDKRRLLDCLNGKTDFHDVLRKTIERHSLKRAG